MKKWFMIFVLFSFTGCAALDTVTVMEGKDEKGCFKIRFNLITEKYEVVPTPCPTDERKK